MRTNFTMRYSRRYVAIAALAMLLLSTAAFGPVACDSSSQPRTVADILASAGATKRALRDANRTDGTVGITAQQDYDISAKLLAANRAYKSFITDELARLAADPSAQPNPDARRNAINAMSSSLRGLDDPEALGIKNPKSKAIWREAIRGLDNVLTGLEALGGK